MKMTPDKERRAAELVGRGMTRGEVARRLGVSARTISRALSKPAVAAIAAEARESLDPSAAEVLRALLGSDKEEIRLRAAVALLRDPPPQAAPASTGPTVTVFGGDLDG